MTQINAEPLFPIDISIFNNVDYSFDTGCTNDRSYSGKALLRNSMVLSFDGASDDPVLVQMQRDSEASARHAEKHLHAIKLSESNTSAINALFCYERSMYFTDNETPSACVVCQLWEKYLATKETPIKIRVRGQLETKLTTSNNAGHVKYFQIDELYVIPAASVQDMVRWHKQLLQLRLPQMIGDQNAIPMSLTLDNPTLAVKTVVQDESKAGSSSSKAWRDAKTADLTKQAKEWIDDLVDGSDELVLFKLFLLRWPEFPHNGSFGIDTNQLKVLVDDEPSTKDLNWDDSQVTRLLKAMQKMGLITAEGNKKPTTWMPGF